MFWLITAVLGVVAYLGYITFQRHQYWQQKGIPSIFPIPVVGQLWQIAIYGQAKFDQMWTNKLGRVFGFYDGLSTVLEVSDTEMLKHIMVKDFGHFVDRRDLEGFNGEIIDQAVSILKGQHWKDVRSVLVPTFTSGKLRQMNPLINECCQSLMANMEKLADNNEEFEAKELYGRTTLDVIATTFFGTKIDSPGDPNNAFVKHAKKAFDFSFFNPVLLIAFIFPKFVPILTKLGIQGFPKDSEEFFVNNTKEILKLRQDSKLDRRDFLQIMLKSLRENDGPTTNGGSAPHAKQQTRLTETQVKDAAAEDGLDIISDDIAHGGKTQIEHTDYKLTTNELVAQAVVFFLAGYETTATALSFLTYVLATHPEVQERLREEIDQIVGDQEPTYDAIAQMKYLDQCVNETLRLYPPLARTERVCTEDWQYKSLHLDKGTVIAIPIYTIHRDPEYWPDPETYDPERFSEENKKKIKPYTFQTFGQGPRNCIGMRFAYYEIKMVMVQTLKRFRIIPSSKTEVPLQLKETVGFLSGKGGIWVKLERL